MVSEVAATWTPATKTCTNVSCHQGSLITLPSPRMTAVWGSTQDTSCGSATEAFDGSP